MTNRRTYHLSDASIAILNKIYTERILVNAKTSYSQIIDEALKGLKKETTK